MVARAAMDADIDDGSKRSADSIIAFIASRRGVLGTKNQHNGDGAGGTKYQDAMSRQVVLALRTL